ncbi:MAG: hypothetical protein NC048_03200 [Bacteroides sp.]|nr:hypothetical protein [Ruminococcus flavefaciens]MCM1554482.1 hypothetical protein [Bacteroides sp.]
MKKFLLLFLPVFFITGTFTSCSSDEDSAADKIVGTYSGTRTGNLTVIVNGQSGTVPMNGSGTATISKLSDKRIRLNYGGDVFEGTVADNHISFETITTTASDQSATMTLNIAASGNIAGSTITIRETYSGSYFVQGSSFPITGSGSVVLNKQ